MSDVKPQGRDLRHALESMVHAAVISRSRNAVETLERLIANLIFRADSPLTDADVIAAALRETFSADVPDHLVARAIASLEERRDIFLSDGRYVVSQTCGASLEQAASEVGSLEKSVADEWMGELDFEALGVSPAVAWRSLLEFLSALLRRHGVRTVALIDPTYTPSVEQSESIGQVLSEVARRVAPSETADELAAALASFLEGIAGKPDRYAYVAMLADTAFSYFALAVPPETTERFRKRLSDLTVLVDTNGLFGLLGIDPLARNVMARIVEVVREHKVPLRFRYHSLSRDELLRSVSSQANGLKDVARSSSAALLAHGVFENNVRRRFHELNAMEGITVADFLGRISLYDRVLHALGVEVYREDWVPEELLSSVSHELGDFLEERYSRRRTPPEKQKSASQVRHDAHLLAVGYEVRRRQATSDRLGALVLTLDGSLVEFDKGFLSRRGAEFELTVEPSTIFPESLVQLLRLYTPAGSSKHFDEAFAQALALPAFRVKSGQAAAASEEIAQFLTRYGDLPAAVAEEVIANQALQDAFGASEVDEAAIEEEISRLLAEGVLSAHSKVELLSEQVSLLEGRLLKGDETSKILGAQLERLRTQASDAVVQESEVRAALATLQAERDRLRDALATERDAARVVHEESANVQERIALLEGRVDASDRERFRERTVATILGAVVAASIGVALVALLAPAIGGISRSDLNIEMGAGAALLSLLWLWLRIRRLWLPLTVSVIGGVLIWAFPKLLALFMQGTNGPID